MKRTDYIPPDTVGSLPGLFQQRCERSPEAIACRQFDDEQQLWQSFSWQQLNQLVTQWRNALATEKLAQGDKVAVMLRNCKEWLVFDIAAQGLGLITVPLYPNDRADNAAYILKHSEAKVLLLEDATLQQDLLTHQEVRNLQLVLCLTDTPDPSPSANVMALSDWIEASAETASMVDTDASALATIVYTSGTTGHPKGVMLSHKNILWNAWSGLHSVPVYPDDVFLSFLPLSHTLERTVGYYLPIMAGATICYARSIPQLAEDLVSIKPTVLISVPRIYERIYNRIQEQLEAKPTLAKRLFQTAVDIGWDYFEFKQKRRRWHIRFLLQPLLNKLVGHKIQQGIGGRLRVAICGGAPLPDHVSKMFIALGLPILQGYGLTETSPVISVNQAAFNLPRSVGLPLQDVELDFSNESELIVKSPGIMLGYWRDDEATAVTIDQQGWLHTGDLAKQDEQGYLHITGRLKDIIVMANGEKVSPADMETAIVADKLIDQALVIGDGRPFLSALLVLSDEAWLQLASLAGINEHSEISKAPVVEKQLLERVQRCLHDFPSYAKIVRIAISDYPWTIDNGLSTPTLKTKRQQIQTLFAADIDKLYEGH